jgi:hypothetical protein
MQRSVAAGLCDYIAGNLTKSRIQRVKDNPDLDFLIHHADSPSDNDIRQWTRVYFHGEREVVVLDEDLTARVEIEGEMKLLCITNATRIHRIQGSFTAAD